MITAVQRLRHLWSFADLINHHIKNEVRNGWVPWSSHQVIGHSFISGGPESGGSSGSLGSKLTSSWQKLK